MADRRLHARQEIAVKVTLETPNQATARKHRPFSSPHIPLPPWLAWPFFHQTNSKKEHCTDHNQETHSHPLLPRTFSRFRRAWPATAEGGSTHIRTDAHSTTHRSQAGTHAGGAEGDSHTHLTRAHGRGSRTPATHAMCRGRARARVKK